MKSAEHKKIVFNVSSIKNWMGGVYYAQNIINLILHNEELSNLYEIHVLGQKSGMVPLCGHPHWAGADRPSYP